MNAPESAAALRPFVTVVMPIRNEATYVARSIGSILRQDYPADRMEILVADGMSTDGTREAVAALQLSDARIRLIDNPGRIVSTGLNAAVPQARGEVIVRVDGHCEIAPSYVSRAVDHLRDRSIAAVGGPLVTVGETALAQTISVAMSSRFGVGDSSFRVGTDKPILVDTVAFPAYPRSAMEQAGPFDEELVRNQDDEYSYRLRALGFNILLADDVRAVYYSRSALRALWRQYFQYGYWKVRVVQKHPLQMRPRQFVPPLFVAALLFTALWAAVTPAGVSALSALIAAYVVASVIATVMAVGTARAKSGTGGGAMLAALPATFAVLHLSYGAGFLVGLVKFAHRWRTR